MWGNVKRTLTSNKCFLCRQVCQQGRKKKARKGRPKILPPDCPFNHTEIDIFSSLFHDTPGCVISTKNNTADLVEILPGQVALYTCRLCSQLFCGRCVKTACVPHEHYFCSSGLSEAFRNQLSAATECPVCKESISFSDVRTSGCVFCQQLSFLKVQCNLCSQRNHRQLSRPLLLSIEAPQAEGKMQSTSHLEGEQSRQHPDLPTIPSHPLGYSKKKHHDLLEKTTHTLDLDIADEMEEANITLGDSVFEQYVCRDIIKLKVQYNK